MGGQSELGPLCTERVGENWIDAGTSCRSRSQPPGPVGLDRDSAPPQSTGQWGKFQSGSVQRALYKALIDDRYLSQVKVVDILYSTLSNGTMSTGELADLQMVAEKSRSIMPRSKKMLELFVEQGKSAKTNDLGPYELATPRHIYAAEAVCFFLKRMGHGKWPMLDRDEVGVGLLMRLAYPSLLSQKGSSLCGPAAFLFDLLQDRPSEYVAYAVDLYERGTAMLGGLSVTPGAQPTNLIRYYSPPFDPTDWLTMASLRDSENWFLQYDTADRELAGATLPGELASWFTKAGYSDVKEDANLARHQRDTNNIDAANRLYSAGYRVCLFIDYQLLEGNSGDCVGDISQETDGGQGCGSVESGSPWGVDRHWVVLRSKIDWSGGTAKMTVYTWGEGNHQVPQTGHLLLSDFLANYYGYVAGKP